MGEQQRKKTKPSFTASPCKPTGKRTSLFALSLCSTPPAPIRTARPSDAGPLFVPLAPSLHPRPPSILAANGSAGTPCASIVLSYLRASRCFNVRAAVARCSPRPLLTRSPAKASVCLLAAGPCRIAAVVGWSYSLLRDTLSCYYETSVSFCCSTRAGCRIRCAAVD